MINTGITLLENDGGAINVHAPFLTFGALAAITANLGSKITVDSGVLSHR